MNFSDIFKLHKKFIDYILEKSNLTHQYLKNISETGKYVEDEIIYFLKAFLPSRYKITKGYILFSSNELDEPSISPQIDIICIDTLVSHSLFKIDKKDGLEIVPKESVVAIFEIKRTLNKKSFNEAREHLSKIIHSVDLTKDDNTFYLPGGIQIGGGLKGGNFNNPLIGIISLLHDIEPQEIIQLIKSDKLPIDILFSFDGLLIAPCGSNKNLKIYNPRNQNENIEYIYRIKNEYISQVDIIAKSIGYILAYLNSTTGKKLEIQNYFFNKNIK